MITAHQAGHIVARDGSRLRVDVMPGRGVAKWQTPSLLARIFDTDINRESTMSAQTSTLHPFNRSATDTQSDSGLAAADHTITAPAAELIDTSTHPVAQPAGALALAWSVEAPDPLAWAAEQPEERPDPLAWAFENDENEADPGRPWYLRPRLPVAAAGVVAAVALAGLALSLHRGGGDNAVPAVTSGPAAAPVTASVIPPTTVETTPPPTQTVVVDQVSSIPRIPQTSTTHLAPPTHVAAPAPSPSPPTWTPKPAEHWPPYWKLHPPLGEDSTDHHDDTHHGP